MSVYTERLGSLGNDINEKENKRATADRNLFKSEELVNVLLLIDISISYLLWIY